jgi:hypothetical protein
MEAQRGERACRPPPALRAAPPPAAPAAARRAAPGVAAAAAAPAATPPQQRAPALPHVPHAPHAPPAPQPTLPQPPAPTADAEAAVRALLRAHAAAGGGGALYAAEEDIIWRELEITHLFLTNTGVLPRDGGSGEHASCSGGGEHTSGRGGGGQAGASGGGEPSTGGGGEPSTSGGGEPSTSGDGSGGSMAALTERALVITNIVAAGSPFRTLQMLKRHPGLLAVPPAALAVRALQLKLLLPAADVADLIYQKPTLLLMEDLVEQVRRAVLLGVVSGLVSGLRERFGGGAFCDCPGRARCRRATRQSWWLQCHRHKASELSTCPPFRQPLPPQVSAAIKQMRALMPGTQWEAKLGSGGTAFMSFCSILGSGAALGGGGGRSSQGGG